MRIIIEIPSLAAVKTFIFGKAKNPLDASVFQKLSLIAFFAWIGLGADGLSSSCYGPEEAFLVLRGHPYLALFVALATVLTIVVISASYSQIIELFPSGGGGYIVASKLLSPKLGMVSGCTLLIDYVLTIAISVASGADALFSFLPLRYQAYKLAFAAAGVLFLLLLNLRGVRESVIVMLPVVVVFVLTHAGGILYALGSHAGKMAVLAGRTAADVHHTYAQLGLAGMLMLMLRAYSMGAGTYTGIEAISNGVSVLRDPKVETARRTMRYMMFSLAFVVIGLMVSYVLYNVKPQGGRTLNAILFSRVFGAGDIGHFLLMATLASEALILFVAAQTGFIDGPRVIATMALDRWFPERFALLSDRLVIKNGIVLMGGAAFAALLLCGGSVKLLIVLYSINVFITFILSQAGMVRHWIGVRATDPRWRKKTAVNGVGLLLTASILVSVIVTKFHEGGWVTLLVTGMLIVLVLLVKKHYTYTARLLRVFDGLAHAAITLPSNHGAAAPAVAAFDPGAKTAVVLVNGFNGLGLHTISNVFGMFRGLFKNFVFVQVGVIDVGTFKGADEIERFREKIRAEVNHYVELMRANGYYAEGIHMIGVDVVSEVTGIAPEIMKRFPESIFFGGQLVFAESQFYYKWLHNYTVFAIQKKFCRQGIPLVLLPVRLQPVPAETTASGLITVS
jgi:amino acid transporter